MTPICSSDHAERSLHCPIFGTTEQCSAWTIQGFAPSRRPRLGCAHAEQCASHIISLRERVSIRETLSPLDEPSIFREKAKGGGRSGVAARRDAAATPPAPCGDGAIAFVGGPGSRTRPGCARRGVLGPGWSAPGCACGGLLGWGMLRGMSGGRRWRGRNQKRLRQMVTDVYGWRCSICHTMISPDATRLRDRLSIDHVLPVSRGGTDTIENLRPAHYGCNAARGDGSRTVRRRPTEIGIAFFPTGPGREPAPTFRFPPNRLKFGKNGETE